MLCPGTGVPSTSGRTGTIRVARGSNASPSVAGVICITSRPYGAVTRFEVSVNSRRPGLALSRSTTTETSPGPSPDSWLAGPRSRTDTRSGAEPTSSSPSGVRCSSSPTRSVRSTIGSLATTSHSSTATATDSSFSPTWRMGKSAIGSS